MKYRIEKIEQIAQKLNALPAYKEKEVSKIEAVKLLQKDVKNLREKGYSFEQIAQIISAEGVDVSASTLKSYVSKTKQKEVQLLEKKDKDKEQNEVSFEAIRTTFQI